jgi:hypothetical protein
MFWTVRWEDTAVPSRSCSQAVSKPVWHTPLLCLQWKTPDDGQRNCLKHVEFHSKNKFDKLVHLVGFIIRNLTQCMVTWTSNMNIVQSWTVIAYKDSVCTPQPCLRFTSYLTEKCEVQMTLYTIQAVMMNQYLKWSHGDEAMHYFWFVVLLVAMNSASLAILCCW